MVDEAAERILLQKAESDLDAGLAHLRERLASETHGKLAFLARAAEGAVLGGLTMLELKPRMREDVRFLIDLAGQVHAGADPAKLTDEHLARALRLRELGLVVKTKDAAFQPVLQMAREAMIARLPDLAVMVSIVEPKDYDDLLRRSFPTAERPREIVAANQKLMLDIFAYAEAHPEILRIPRSLVPKLAHLARDVTTWQVQRVEEGLRLTYGPLDSVQEPRTPSAP